MNAIRQTSRFKPGYDCPLPDDALSELLGKRLPQRATERLPAVWRRVLYLLAWLAVPVVLVALLGVVLTGLHDKPATQNSATIQAPSGQPTPTPAAQALAVHPPAVAEHPILLPRAQLVKPPVPRAQLVRLPRAHTQLVALTPDHLDESHRITMPYNVEVLATLRGFLENENQLPRVGHIGDMYVVMDTPWIWVTVPGTTAPTWVDP